MYGLNVAHQLSWKAADSEAVDDLAASQWMHTVSHTHTHTRVAAAEGDSLEFTLSIVLLFFKILISWLIVLANAHNAAFC